jgi:bacterioferritin
MSANLTSYDRDGVYPFLSEVAEMRRRARQHIQAATTNADQSVAHPTVLRLLNEALTTELACVSRYRSHSAMTDGAVADSVRDEFLKYAQEERGHAVQLAERIVQLGGEPVLQPPGEYSTPANGSIEQIEADGLADLIEEDLIAERIAIESYREILQYLGANDPTTRQLLESILAVEVAHAEELASLRSELLRRDRQASISSVRLPMLELQ